MRTENLSLQEKEVLKKLGLYDLTKVKTKVKTKAKGRLEPEPYILLRESKCLFCGTVSHSCFKLSPPRTNPYTLEGKKITSEDVLSTDVVRKEVGICFTCKQCHKTLEKETKEELINRILILKGGKGGILKGGNKRNLSKGGRIDE